MPHKTRMKLGEQPAERGINAGQNAGFELTNALALTRVISTGSSTMQQMRYSTLPSPQWQKLLFASCSCHKT